jgi:CheY-like chemotaxis protein
MKMTTAPEILIVDDDPNDTEMTRIVLSRAGFEVMIEAVTHGEAALTLLRKKNDLPSLIFLDLKMSGLSGIETLRLIRADERLKNITVVILTNSLLEADRKESYAAGADDFLQKAFDIDLFATDVKSALERWLIQ